MKKFKKYGYKVLVSHGEEFIKIHLSIKKVFDELLSNGIIIYELGAVEPNPRHTIVNKDVTLCKGGPSDFPILKRKTKYLSRDIFQMF